MMRWHRGREARPRLGQVMSEHYFEARDTRGRIIAVGPVAVVGALVATDEGWKFPLRGTARVERGGVLDSAEVRAGGSGRLITPVAIGGPLGLEPGDKLTLYIDVPFRGAPWSTGCPTWVSSSETTRSA